MSLKSALYSHLKGDYGVTFTVNATTNVITAAGHTRINGDKVRLASTGTLPAGLAVDTDYFIINKSGNDFKLSAISGGSEIDITDAGTGTHSLGTAITDLVVKRIYAGHAPQDPGLPYIVYRRISSTRTQHMTAPDGLVKDRIQFDIFDDDPEVVDNIRDALRLWLDGYDKGMGTEVLDVRLVTLEDINDDVIPPVHGDESGIHSTSMDFFFYYAESIPVH